MHTLERADVLIAVLCGLPGSGKTNLAAAITQIAEDHGVAAHHLCLDTILEQHSSREGLGGIADICKDAAAGRIPEGPTAANASTAAGAVYGRAAQQEASVFSAGAWKASRKQLLQEVELHLQQWSQRRRSQQQQQQQQWLLLLVDDINHYSSMRYEFVQLARSHGGAFLQVYMDCAVVVAQQRNRQRPAASVVHDAVLQRLAGSFEPPQPGRHSWEAGHTLVVDCSSNSVTMMGDSAAAAAQPEAAAKDAEGLARAVYAQLLLHWGPAMQPPPSEAELAAQRAAGQAGNAASRLHQLDLTTRTMMHATLAAADKEVRAAAAADLNAKRKQLLQQFRQQQHAATDIATEGAKLAELADMFRNLCSKYA